MLTKEMWKALNEKQQWDIKVALRGPDCPNSETLKWFTTAVIRGQVSKVMRVGGTVNPDLLMVVVPVGWSGLFPGLGKELRKALAALNMPQLYYWNSHHFFEHVITAANHLDLPVRFIGDTIWAEGIKHNHVTTIQMWLEWLKTSEGSGCGPSYLVDELTRHLKVVKGESDMPYPPPPSPTHIADEEN